MWFKRAQSWYVTNRQAYTFWIVLQFPNNHPPAKSANSSIDVYDENLETQQVSVAMIRQPTPAIYMAIVTTPNSNYNVQYLPAPLKYIITYFQPAPQ